VSRTSGSTAEETRSRIIGAARELFAERGYAGTSVRDLAERLGITKAALYYHFPGKADVLLALVEPMLTGLDALADEAGDREADLRAFVGLLAEWGPSMRSVFSDPTAKRDLADRLDAQTRFARLERALSGGGDPLPVRCALGAAHAGVLPTLAAGEPVGPAECERIVRAALAAWDAAAV
jgi:AcrR family transcriptional regulator